VQTADNLLVSIFCFVCLFAFLPLLVLVFSIAPVATHERQSKARHRSTLMHQQNSSLFDAALKAGAAFLSSQSMLTCYFLGLFVVPSVSLVCLSPPQQFISIHDVDNMRIGFAVQSSCTTSLPVVSAAVSMGDSVPPGGGQGQGDADGGGGDTDSLGAATPTTAASATLASVVAIATTLFFTCFARV
jgi:hypothetical protein